VCEEGLWFGSSALMMSLQSLVCEKLIIASFKHVEVLKKKQHIAFASTFIGSKTEPDLNIATLTLLTHLSFILTQTLSEQIFLLRLC